MNLRFKSSTENTAPIKVTFELVGEPPDYTGDTSFSVDINQVAGDSVTATCLYPNRNYLVTARTFRTPDTKGLIAGNKELVGLQMTQEISWSELLMVLSVSDSGGEEQSLVTIPINLIVLSTSTR